jgi:hypothetical protein
MQFVLNLPDANPQKIATELRAYAQKLTSHAVEVPDPDPTPAELTAAAQLIDDKKALSDAKDQDAKAATGVTLAAGQAGKNLLTMLVAWGEKNVTDPAKAALVFTIKKTATPTTEIAQVLGLALTFGDSPGRLDAHWEPVDKSRSYEIQIRYPAQPNADWIHFKTLSGSSAKLKDLLSAQVVQIRVRAIGPKGLEGPWCDFAEHLVP